MKRKLLAASLVWVAVAASTVTYAQGRPAGAGNDRGQRPSAGQQRNVDSMRQQADLRRQEAEAKRAEAEAKNRSEQSRAEHPPNEQAADAAISAEENAGGGDTAAEMRDRRDESKAIKEEYKSNREPGQEGANRDSDSENVADEQKAKAKKPWWKLWGD